MLAGIFSLWLSPELGTDCVRTFGYGDPVGDGLDPSTSGSPPGTMLRSFFSSVLELDRVQEQDKSPKTQEAQVKKQPTGRSTRKKADEPEKK